MRQSDHHRAGPGSVSWTINRETVVVAGWGRAVLLQLAHPAIAAGVHHHSTFRGSLLSSARRFHSTVGAMLAITFGNLDQMIDAAAGINAIHDRVRGRITPGSSDTYSAHDPDLQRWVHATLLESMPLTYELLVGPLSDRDRDAFIAESTIMEPLLGMPPGSLPRNAVQLDAYLREMRESNRLVVSDTSRQLAQALLYPPRWYLAWPAFRALQRLTIGSLPPAIREAYGFAWTDRDQRAMQRWAAVLRTSRRLLPKMAREWPVSRRSPEDVSRRDR